MPKVSTTVNSKQIVQERIRNRSLHDLHGNGCLNSTGILTTYGQQWVSISNFSENHHKRVSKIRERAFEIISCNVSPQKKREKIPSIPNSTMSNMVKQSNKSIYQYAKQQRNAASRQMNGRHISGQNLMFLHRKLDATRPEVILKPKNKQIDREFSRRKAKSISAFSQPTSSLCALGFPTVASFYSKFVSLKKTPIRLRI